MLEIQRARGAVLVVCVVFEAFEDRSLFRLTGRAGQAGVRMVGRAWRTAGRMGNNPGRA
jgi:hypothetical protein